MMLSLFPRSQTLAALLAAASLCLAGSSWAQSGDEAPGAGTKVELSADSLNPAADASPKASASPSATPAASASPSATPAAAATPKAPTGPLPPAGVALNANSDFSQKGDGTLPKGWANTGTGAITVEDEGSGHFARLVSQEPGSLVQMSSTVPITTGVKGLETAVTFRTANVKFMGTNYVTDARMMFRFQDAEGKAVGKNPPDIIFDSHAKDWTPISRKFLVPEGATALVVLPSVNKAQSGTLDLQTLKIAPMSPEEAQAIVDAATLAEKQKAEASAAADKKKAEDEAAIQGILALPSISKELKVSGNKLVTADGTQVILQGVNVVSLEWGAKGEGILRSMKVAIDDWKANVVRLPVMDTFWFGQGKPPKVPPNDQEAYRKVVDDAIKLAAARGAYVVLDLHRFHAPEQGAADFWKDAAARYKDNPAVLFDIFNEPTGITWEQWQKGGTIEKKDKAGVVTTFESPGMQGLVDAVRGTGAKNIIVAGGLGYAYDLSGILNGFALDDKGGNGIMYATHFYNWHGGWQKHFLDLVDKYPLLVGEFGADKNKMAFIPAKNQEDPMTWSPDALAMVQKYKLNWTAFSLHPKSTPVLISDWDYTPTPAWGVFVKDALGGKVFELGRLR